MDSTRKPRRRVKSGCRTCKTRRVKCDESLPACQRCLSTGRVCDGYGIWGGGGNAYGQRPFNHNPKEQVQKLHCATPTPRQHGAVVPGTRIEKEYFDWFVHRTTTKMPGVFGSVFWDRLVVQASMEEPAVWHAVLALTGAHKRDTIGDSGDEGEGFTLRHYNKAIVLLRGQFVKRDRDSIRVTLIACMLFVCLEIIRGRYEVGHVHLQSGLRVLSEMQGGHGEVVLRGGMRSTDDYLVESFTRLDVLSSLFGYRSRQLYALDREERPLPIMFESIERARQRLDGLSNAIYHLSTDFVHGKQDHMDLLGRQKSIQTALTSWLQTYKASQISLRAQMSTIDAFAIPLLRNFHAMATIMAATCLTLDEEIFDAHTPAFTAIVQESLDMAIALQPTLDCERKRGLCSNSLGFTADMGFIPPLYYAALKCRVPSVRRQAIDLLRGTPHREGVWNGLLVADVATEVMHIEEGLTSPKENVDPCPEPPSGSSRVKDVQITLPNDSTGKASMTCRFPLHDGTWTTLSREFAFGASRVC